MSVELEDRIRASLHRRADAVDVDVPDLDLARPARSTVHRWRRLEVAAVAAALVLFVAAGAVLVGEVTWARDGDPQLLVPSDPRSGTEEAAPDATPETPPKATPEVVPEPGSAQLEAGCRSEGVNLVAFMEIDATQGEIDAVDRRLVRSAAVESLRFLDQDASYEEFAELFAVSPSMVASVKAEDLPASFRVVAQEAALERLDRELSALPGVREVGIAPCGRGR